MERAGFVPRRGGAGGTAAPQEPDGHDGDADAWRARDPVRFVGHCIASEAGAAVQPTSSPEGLGWIFALRAMSVFVSLDTASERVAVDVPVARVPERQRVPVLRAALELSEGLAPARLCLRDDLIVLRRVARLALVTAASLRQALRVSAEGAERLAGLLATWFDARPPFSEEQRPALSWAAAGRSRPLKSFSVPPPPARSLPPPPPATHRPAAPPPPPLPPLPQPMSARVAPVESGKAALLRDPESLPDILSPLFAAPSAAAPATATPLPEPQPARQPTPGSNRPGPLPELTRSSTLPEMGVIQAEVRGSDLPAAPDRRNAPVLPVARPGAEGGLPVSVPVSIRPPAAGPEGEVEAPPRKERERSPADRFCQLLRDAQALATALSFQDRPGVMFILIRSAVFRSILEHGDALPHAVAHLYRATAAVTRDLDQAEAAGRRGNPAVIAEPALHAMERIVSARAHVPEEKGLQIEPLNSAAHAREHLARYLREIERAPTEPALRHFLALGALSELLVRARLPQKTDQRLREIVAYAHRDGPKSGAIDLMMTALNRIVAQ